MSSISPYGIRSVIEDAAREIVRERAAAEPASAPLPSAEEIEAQNAKATAAWLEAQKVRALAPKMNRAARRAGASQARKKNFQKVLREATAAAQAWMHSKEAQDILATAPAQELKPDAK